MNDLTVGERTVGSRIDDVTISSMVKSKLIANWEIKAGDIDVSSSQIKSDAERIARAARSEESRDVVFSTRGEGDSTGSGQGHPSQGVE